MQNIFREFAWRMLCSVEIILNKIHETLFFHQSATYWGTLILAKPIKLEYRCMWRKTPIHSLILLTVSGYLLDFTFWGTNVTLEWLHNKWRFVIDVILREDVVFCPALDVHCVVACQFPHLSWNGQLLTKHFRSRLRDAVQSMNIILTIKQTATMTSSQRYELARLKIASVWFACLDEELIIIIIS